MQARMKLQTEKLSKSGHNKFAGYEYFELSDFLPAVQTIFNEIGLCGVVSFSSDLATLTITDIDDNSNIVITSPMADANLKGCHPIQNLGAVETYTRRYLWVTALEIVEHDALDATTGNQANITAKPKMAFDIEDAKFNKLGSCTDLASLKATYTDLFKKCPDNLKSDLEAYKNEIKLLIEDKK